MFFFIKNLFLGFFNFIQNKFIYRVSAKYSCQLLELYLYQPYTFHLHRNSAEIVRNLTSLVSSMFSKTLLPGLQACLELLTVIGVLAVMIMAEPVASLVAAVILSFSAFVFYLGVREKVIHWGLRITESDADSIRWINQSLGSVKDIVLSGQQKFFRDSFSRPVNIGAHYQALANTLPSLPRLFIEILVIICIMVTILILLFVKGFGRHDTSTLGLFGVAAMRVLPAFGKLVSNLTLIKENTAAINIISNEFQLFPHESKQHSISRNEEFS